LYGTDVDEQVGEAWRLEQFDDVVDPSLGEEFDRGELVGLGFGA
jgi:hypothetical protein